MMPSTGRTLILSMREVKELLTMTECVRLQEEAFAQEASGTAWNSDPSWIQSSGPIAYPAVGKMMAGGIDPKWRGIKVTSSRMGDPSGRYRMQTLLLLHAETLVPLAIMEANYLGQLRTGAGAGVATKYMARKDAQVIGILGAGATARFALKGLRAIDWPVKLAYVFSRSAENRSAYAREMSEATGYRIHPMNNPEFVVHKAEILITGTTSPEAAFHTEWVQPGTHINAMGAKTEIPHDLFLRSRNIGDAVSVAVSDGKLSTAIKAGVITRESCHGGIGEVILGHKPGRISSDEITLFDSSGHCVQDIAAGAHVYELAKERGLGKWMEFHNDDPLW
jgi:alanine dehydrogenase